MPTRVSAPDHTADDRTQLLGRLATAGVRRRTRSSRPTHWTTPASPGVQGGAASVRWVMLHMIEETARHAGHLDAVHELVDGHKGYY